MNWVDALLGRDETQSRIAREETALGYPLGLELAPTTLASLVTWDVSGHAQCEKDRMINAWRVRGAARVY
jgi:hypothetical protein